MERARLVHFIIFIFNDSTWYMYIDFSPFLKRWGYGMTTNELIIVWWGGLRGAVGLALAMIVSLICDTSKDESLKLAGQRILFHTGGIAFLTLAINGTTTEFFIKYLGMNKISAASKRMKVRYNCASSSGFKIQGRLVTFISLQTIF